MRPHRLPRAPFRSSDQRLLIRKNWTRSILVVALLIESGMLLLLGSTNRVVALEHHCLEERMPDNRNRNVHSPPPTAIRMPSCHAAITNLATLKMQTRRAWMVVSREATRTDPWVRPWPPSFSTLGHPPICCPPWFPWHSWKTLPPSSSFRKLQPKAWFGEQMTWIVFQVLLGRPSPPWKGTSNSTSHVLPKTARAILVWNAFRAIGLVHSLIWILTPFVANWMERQKLMGQCRKRRSGDISRVEIQVLPWLFTKMLCKTFFCPKRWPPRSHLSASICYWSWPFYWSTRTSQSRLWNGLVRHFNY